LCCIAHGLRGFGTAVAKGQFPDSNFQAETQSGNGPHFKPEPRLILNRQALASVAFYGVMGNFAHDE